MIRTLTFRSLSSSSSLHLPIVFLFPSLVLPDLLYSRPRGASEYPAPIGRLEGSGAGARAVLYTKEELDSSQFFKVGPRESHTCTHLSSTLHPRARPPSPSLNGVPSRSHFSLPFLIRPSHPPSLLSSLLPGSLPSSLSLYRSQALDKYLKQAQARFDEVFREFDRNRTGELDSAELREFIRALMPRATPSQHTYFQASSFWGASCTLSYLLACPSPCMAPKLTQNLTRSHTPLSRAGHD